MLFRWRTTTACL
ncbi:unnamed protein product [Linum tenue]|uniref:Uncharacterized protein n=1 Tax=Linum tenue TaxID=586396 RepID=A0AAV0R5G6_9ROSI|nr:unnamed protein product [Linum tenue]